MPCKFESASSGRLLHSFSHRSTVWPRNWPTPHVIFCLVSANHSTRLSFSCVSLGGRDDGATRSPVRRLRSVFFWLSHSVVPSIRSWYFDPPPAMRFGDLATIGWRVNVAPTTS